MQVSKKQVYLKLLHSLEKDQAICLNDMFEVASNLSFDSSEWVEFVKVFHEKMHTYICITNK